MGHHRTLAKGEKAILKRPVANTGGQLLPHDTLHYFNARFDHDFSRVRVHHDPAAVSATNDLRARAFTLGQDIFFGAGEYKPQTDRGKHLLAHELAHTIEQNTMSGDDEPIQCMMGDNHDLKAKEFSGDTDLEAAYDGEKILGKHLRSTGEAVEKIQQALLDLGYELPTYGVDGIFGAETERAVQAFQRDSGLEFKQVDGRVGPITMELLDERFAAGVTPLPPPLTQQELIDPRIDIGAQYALRRLSQGTAEEREDAHAMFNAVKNETLKGIFGDDLWVAYRMAWRIGTRRWLLVPEGEDASLALDPREPLGAYTMFFREHIRFTPERIDRALRRAWAMTLPSTPSTRVKKVEVRKSGQGFRDFEAQRGGGLDLGYHTGWQNIYWYANFRFVVDVEVDGDINKCRYFQRHKWESSFSKNKAFDIDTVGLAELKIRPLRTGYWVNIDGNHVMWEDGPGMTTEGQRTRRDLPYFLDSQYIQTAVGEDGEEVSVAWGFRFALDQDGNWTLREDNLDASASHS